MTVVARRVEIRVHFQKSLAENVVIQERELESKLMRLVVDGHPPSELVDIAFSVVEMILLAVRFEVFRLIFHFSIADLSHARYDSIFWFRQYWADAEAFQHSLTVNSCLKAFFSRFNRPILISVFDFLLETQSERRGI